MQPIVFLSFLDEVQIRSKAHFYKLYWRNRLLFSFLWTFTDQSIVLPNVTWISYYIYWSLSKVFYEKEILNIHVCGYDTFYTGLTVSRNSQFVDRARQQGYSRYETNEIMTRNVVKISIDWKVHQDMMPAFPQNLEKLILKIDFGFFFFKVTALLLDAWFWMLSIGQVERKCCCKMKVFQPWMLLDWKGYLESFIHSFWWHFWQFFQNTIRLWMTSIWPFCKWFVHTFNFFPTISNYFYSANFIFNFTEFFFPI